MHPPRPPYTTLTELGHCRHPRRRPDLLPFPPRPAIFVLTNRSNHMVKTSTAGRKRGTARRARSEAALDADAEQRILDAAHAIFVRRGTAGARMQEIADEAGVNKALLHYYFRNKERLATAVFQRVARKLFPGVMDILAGDDTIEDKVRRVVAFELDVLAASPFAPAYILGELNQHPERARDFMRAMTGVEVDGVLPKIRVQLARQIDAEARVGTIRRIPVEQFVINLISLCVFPFAARPLLGIALGLDDAAFRKFLDERKRHLPQFFLDALRP